MTKNDFLKAIINSDFYEFDFEKGWIFRLYKRIGFKSFLLKEKERIGSDTTNRALISLNGEVKGVLIPRLLWVAYYKKDIGDGKVICHKDGNSFNNRIDNLVIETRRGFVMNGKRR